MFMDKKVFSVLEEMIDPIMAMNSKPKISKNSKIQFKPFYVSLTVKNEEQSAIELINGGVRVKDDFSDFPHYKGRMEMRMGDHFRGGAVAHTTFSLPYDLDVFASKKVICDEADSVFWDCAKDYLYRFNAGLGQKKKRDDFVFFSKESPSNFISKKKEMKFSIDKIEDMLKTVSKTFLSNDIYKIEADFNVSKSESYFINSEGSKIYSNYNRFNLYFTFSIRGDNNILLPSSIVYHGTDLSKLPSLEELLVDSENTIKQLHEIKVAPIEKNGTYPTIVDQQNHGVLWHEVFGHPIEGNKVSDDGETEDDSWEDSKSSLFQGKIGKRIVKPFINVYDDPTIKHLDGHYNFDEDGVPAQKVTLIENGILRNYLHSRETAGYFKKKSNGHARSDNSESNAPEPRMSNIVIETSNGISYDELKEQLIKEIVDQKKEYGLIMKGCNGGWVIPSESSFNTYPNNVFRVYKNSKEKRVRGIYVVGTPYHILENIIATSNEYAVFNGVCGSSSGNVPSTQTAPHALIKSIEVNRIPKSNYEQLMDPVIKL